MKDLITKLKTLDYKQFALQHGEKIGIGVIGIVVLVCVAMTNWAAEFTTSPREMIEKAEDAEKNLKKNVWPDAEKAKFFPPLAAQTELARVLEEIEVSRFEWSKPLSPKLHQVQLPADEPDVLAAMELRAQADLGAIGFPVAVEMPEVADEPEPARGPSRGGRGKADRGKRAAADESPLPAPRLGQAAGFEGGFASQSGTPGEKARGRRFVVVTGVVDLKKQYGKLYTALHLNSVPEAASYLDYLDFKIQRQRAVPGPNHWTGEWTDVAKENSIEILEKEVSEFDPEIVPTANTVQVFTSPLPRRIDDEWDPELVAHPRIPTLSEAEQELEIKKNKAALEVAPDEEGSGGRRGFAKVQRDAKRIQSRAMGVEGGSKMADSMAKMMGSQASKPADMMKSMMAGGMGMAGMMGMGGRGAAAVDTTADYALFRFFDFDVEPGECYRYRVQLIIANPSYGESFVSAPTVADGEQRESPWSEPSTPAVVEKDVEYALLSVKTKGSRPAAELNVVQFDDKNGTYLEDKFSVSMGAYVAAVKKSWHLDVGEPKFEMEDVTFTSKDVLLDGAAAPDLSESTKKELGLDAKAAKNLSKAGKLDMAVTVNRFGEIVELDAGSRDALQPYLQKVEEERKDYDDLKDTGKKKKDDDLFSSLQPDNDKAKGKKKRKKKRDKTENPLRMMSNMMSGMMPGGMMPPSGTSGSGGKKK
jgi:hypothetical protein